MFVNFCKITAATLTRIAKAGGFRFKMRGGLGDVFGTYFPGALLLQCVVLRAEFLMRLVSCPNLVLLVIELSVSFYKRLLSKSCFVIG